MITKLALSREDALELISRGEDHFFDHKSRDVSGAKLQKAAVAFANADGGDVLVGIADEKNEPDAERRWNGRGRIEDYNGALQAVNAIRPGIDISYTFYECEAYPDYVLHLHIEKSTEVVHTADNSVYVRLGAQSMLVSDPERIQALAFAKGAVSFEDQLVQDTKPEDVIDTPEMISFLAGYSPKSDPLEFTVMQNLLDRNDWTPRVCSILLFAQYPSGLLPRKCAVKIARYETKEDDPEREHLKETETIEGPLYQLIMETVAAVTRIMSSIKIWTTEGLRTVAYPPEAIWEITVNAIIHRDYSISDDVQIRIFDNRIEIASPGRLPSFVTAANILDTRFSRNPKIVRTLNRYPDAPNKDLGEGLNTAFQKMKEFRLQPPSIEEGDNQVVVTVKHIPLARPSELILEFLAREPRITNKQCRDLTGIKSENLVKLEFYKLRDEGLLEMIPGLKGPAAAWQLTELGKAARKQGAV
jgi:ATP-dependent DNA helicase RecG